MQFHTVDQSVFADVNEKFAFEHVGVEVSKLTDGFVESRLHVVLYLRKRFHTE